MAMGNVKALIIAIPLLLGMVVLFGSTPALAAPPAGEIIIASGEVIAIQSDSTTRPLQRKSEFYAGETIQTGVDAYTHLKFSDGALLALRADSQFRVDEHHFDADSAANSSTILSLLKGGLRIITGLVAKQNPGKYKVNTPAGTIGVRGTDFELVLDEEVVIGFWEGSGYLINEAGTFLFGEGEQPRFARVADRRSAPMGLTRPPRPLQDSRPPQESPPPDGRENTKDLEEFMRDAFGRRGAREFQNLPDRDTRPLPPPTSVPLPKPPERSPPPVIK